MANILDYFGFNFKTNDDKQIPSVIAPTKNDGA